MSASHEPDPEIRRVLIQESRYPHRTLYQRILRERPRLTALRQARLANNWFRHVTDYSVDSGGTLTIHVI